MDANECLTLIPAARESAGTSTEELLARIDRAATQFAQNVNDKFRRQ
jgi:hypothetical protein